MRWSNDHDYPPETRALALVLVLVALLLVGCAIGVVIGMGRLG